jgi:hypothetical protein
MIMENQDADKALRLYVCNGEMGAKIRNYGRNWGRER